MLHRVNYIVFHKNCCLKFEMLAGLDGLTSLHRILICLFLTAISTVRRPITLAAKEVLPWSEKHKHSHLAAIGMQNYSRIIVELIS